MCPSGIAISQDTFQPQLGPDGFGNLGDWGGLGDSGNAPILNNGGNGLFIDPLVSNLGSHPLISNNGLSVDLDWQVGSTLDTDHFGGTSIGSGHS